MKNHDEYWLLEQWGLWSRGSRVCPRGYESMESRPPRDRWEISEAMAEAVEETVTGMAMHFRITLKRAFVDRDYDVRQEPLQIAINRFAVAHGLATAENFEPIEPKPRKTIARRNPGPWLHPNRHVYNVRHLMPRRPVITLEWLKAGA